MQTTSVLSDYERERGKPMPNLNYSITQMALIVALSAFRAEYSIFSELSLDLDGLRTTPDICVYPKRPIEFTQDEIRMTEPPLLAVEIENPTQSTQELVDKIRGMLAAGVASCWLVQPALQTVTVFAGAMIPKTFSEGKIDDATLDITVTLASIFSENITS